MARHPGSIDQHGPSWRVRLCVDGQRHTFMMPEGATKEDAEQHAREKHAELHWRNGRGLPGPMRFSELLARYEDVKVPEKAPRTQETYAHSLQAFKTYFVEQGGDPLRMRFGLEPSRTSLLATDPLSRWAESQAAGGA